MIRFVILFAAACSPAVLSATPRSITLDHVNRMTIEDATAEAQAHCQKYNRDAELVPDDSPDGRATFKCVDR